LGAPERPATIYRLIMQDSIKGLDLRLHQNKRKLASALADGLETAARPSEQALPDLIRG
jgi:hypothetical protein